MLKMLWILLLFGYGIYGYLVAKGIVELPFEITNEYIIGYLAIIHSTILLKINS